jgi:Arc/MetJ-type ribon-helix-helix transcriptional regulator
MPKAKYSLLRVMVRDDMMEWLRDRAVTATDERGRYIYVSEVVREALSRYRSTEQENMPALVIRKAGTSSSSSVD